MTSRAVPETSLRQRSFDAVVGRGLLRGALCGAGLGLLPSLALVGMGLPAGAGELQLGFGLGLVGAVLGALCGLLAAAGAVAVLAVAERRERRRDWGWSVLASVMASAVAVLVFSVGWWVAKGTALPAVVIATGAVGCVAVALWQVRSLVRPLD